MDLQSHLVNYRLYINRITVEFKYSKLLGECLELSEY